MMNPDTRRGNGRKLYEDIYNNGRKNTCTSEQMD